MVYKATMRRNGYYSSPAAGMVDMNESLIEPFFRLLSINWEQFFGSKIQSILQNHEQAVLKLIQKSCTDFAQVLCFDQGQSVVSQERLDRTRVHIFSDLSRKLQASRETMVEVLQKEQREVNRLGI